MGTIIYGMLVFDMCIYDYSFVYPVYIMIDIYWRIYGTLTRSMFEYNNLNIVDRFVKIRGKYFRGLAMTWSYVIEKGKAGGGRAQWI